MKLCLGTALLVSAVIVSAACGSSNTTVRPRPNGPTVSSSRLILGGTVRCTATLTTPVAAGHELGVTFTFHNLSEHTADVQLVSPGVWLIIRSPDGPTYDTRVPFEGAEFSPYYAPGPMAPGSTKTVRLPYVLDRWGGPLRITPSCGSSVLRTVRVAVASPGRPTSATAALKAVVAATGHFLDNCRPKVPGVAVTGWIDAPKHSRPPRPIPPLHTRCSISLRAETNLDVAQVLVTTTPQLLPLRLDQTYERFTWLRSPVRRTNALTVAWQFVVTKDGATTIGSGSEETTTNKGWMNEWQWTSAGPTDPPGGGSCGSSGGGSGPGSQGPLVDFVSACR